MIVMVIKKEIACWIILIGAVLAFLSPIVALILAEWHNNKTKEGK